MKTRPIDEVLLGLAVWQLLALRSAADAAQRAASFAKDAASDPTVIERITDVAIDKLIARLLPAL